MHRRAPPGTAWTPLPIPWRVGGGVRILLALLVTAGALDVTARAQAQPSADALAKAIQTRYDRIRDFSADFVHSYRGGVLRTEARERGTVVVKRPGRMKWIYTAPEQKQFVADGLKVYSYIPQDRQVIVSDVPPDDQATTPALFLAGKGDIARDFAASYSDRAPTTPATVVSLRLTPRRPEPEYEYLVMSVDPSSLQIRALTTRDAQGGESTLSFSNLKENQGISDKEFAFRIPRGVDVITNGSRN